MMNNLINFFFHLQLERQSQNTFKVKDSKIGEAIGQWREGVNGSNRQMR